MDAPHRDSNPGSVEVLKRPLSASAQKGGQKEHTQKPKGSAVMASIEPQALFGGTPAGSEHAPPVEAVMKEAVHRGRHPKTVPLSSLLRSLLRSPLRFTLLLLMIPPWFLHCNKFPRRRVLRDRLPQIIGNLLSSKLRNRPLLEKVPPWNPPRKKSKQKMCGHQTTTTTSSAMTPLTRLLLLYP